MFSKMSHTSEGEREYHAVKCWPWGKSCNLRMWGAQTVHKGVMSSVWNQSVKNRGLHRKRNTQLSLEESLPSQFRGE